MYFPRGLWLLRVQKKFSLSHPTRFQRGLVNAKYSIEY